MHQLILLGTVHRDPAGKGRLRAALDRIDPAVVSLEVSPASVLLRVKRTRAWMDIYLQRLDELSWETGRTKRELLAGAGLGGVFEYLRLPYEYRAALAWVRERSRPLFLLDESTLAISFLSRVEAELLNRDNLAHLAEFGAETTLAAEVATEYAKAGRWLDRDQTGPGNLGSVGDKAAWESREKHLAGGLRGIYQELLREAGRTWSGMPGLPHEAAAYLPDRIVLPGDIRHLHVGGWEHLLENSEHPTLYDRLVDLAPERLLCPEPGSDLETRWAKRAL